LVERRGLGWWAGLRTTLRLHASGAGLLCASTRLLRAAPGLLSAARRALGPGSL
jgi:hypothetical protein